MTTALILLHSKNIRKKKVVLKALMGSVPKAKKPLKKNATF